MKTPIKFKEYIWLVNTIRRARRITLAEINEKWMDTDMSEGIPLARSTFNRHKDAIFNIFGILIDCDRHNGYEYYICNEHVLNENSVQNWMLSTLSVNNLISESLTLQDRILLECIPSEGDNLKKVIEAMKNSVKIEIDYKKYGSETSNRLNFEPYCIKLFKQRWYVLGHFHQEDKKGKSSDDYFGTFSLDRIVDIRVTDTKFKIDPNFNAKEYFDECYGVLSDDGSIAMNIVIRAYGRERYYLKDLPIHHSQKEISGGENHTDFELHMRPTRDFCSYIMSRGAMLKVLSPQWLAETLRAMHQDAYLMYLSEEK